MEHVELATLILMTHNCIAKCGTADEIGICASKKVLIISRETLTIKCTRIMKHYTGHNFLLCLLFGCLDCFFTVTQERKYIHTSFMHGN